MSKVLVIGPPPDLSLKVGRKTIKPLLLHQTQAKRSKFLLQTTGLGIPLCGGVANGRGGFYKVFT